MVSNNDNGKHTRFRQGRPAAGTAREYFARAAGTARRVWNWALAEWLRQRNAGGKPNAMALKKQFNAFKYLDPAWLDENGQPWLKTMHRDSHAQPFAHLARAWSRYFDQIRAKLPAHPPRFKRKGRCPGGAVGIRKRRKNRLTALHSRM